MAKAKPKQSTFERWRYGQMNRQPRRNLVRRLESQSSILLGSHVKSFVDRLRHQSEVHEQESHSVARFS